MSHQRILERSVRDTQTVTLPLREYEHLRTVASHFEMMRNLFELNFFAPPPTRDGNVVMRELRQTGKYGAAFLKSIDQGLKKSTYFRKASLR